MTLPSAGIFGSARVAPSGPITPTFQQQGFSATDLATYTFSAVPVGTASATRRAVVAFAWASSAAQTLSSMTIGGVSATVDADSGALNGNRRIVLCSAVVPSGTTADVVATLSGTAARAGYALSTLSRGAPTGQFDTDANTGSSGMTVNTSTGDVVIGGLLATHSANTVTITTSGLDTEWYNDLHADGAQYYRHAGGVIVATGSTASFTWVMTNVSQMGGVAAAYA